jgi:16S rRNA (adenine(1408)-N(1))-methyltransferase
VIIDIGTGDGRFVYQSAREHPDRFYIGVDAQAGALEKISQKIYRKPAKGGLPNALFIQAAVEALPMELNGAADAVHIHFPWGSLLRAVAMGDEAVLGKLRSICAPGAPLEIVIALDSERDKSEISRLKLEPLTPEFVKATLIPRYHAAGCDAIEYRAISPSEWPQLPTSWARRLAGNAERSLTYLIARAATLTETSRRD